MKKIFSLKIILLFLSIVVLLAICSSQFFIVRNNFSLPKTEKDSLISVASKALETRDVPVGSILIYKKEIIGTGYNTVMRDSNTSGHAEINAMNDAVRKFGFKKFSELNRDSLFLITTFEPCMMCRGAIIEYNISHVVFMKPKGLLHWIINDSKQFRYEWNKLKTDSDELQDSLFELHPDYHRK